MNRQKRQLCFRCLSGPWENAKVTVMQPRVADVYSGSATTDRGGEVIELWGQVLHGLGRWGVLGAQSEEGSDSGMGASWQASGSAVAGEGGGEGGEGGETGCSWPSSGLSKVLLLSPAPSTVISPRSW